MATVKFHLQRPYIIDKGKKKLNNKETRLYCFLIIDRLHMIKIKTEHVIFPKQWDFAKQGKRETLAGSIEFNNQLNNFKKDIFRMYQKIIKDQPDITFAQISHVLKEYGKTKEIPFLANKRKEFWPALDEFLNYLEGNTAPGTVKKFNTLKKSLSEFCSGHKLYKNLSFSMIDFAFLDTYTAHLRTQKPRGRQKTRPEGLQDGLLNDTIGKYIENIKTFCKWAEERKYNTKTTYKDFTNVNPANRKRMKQDHDIVTLTLNELRQFYTHDFSEKPTFDRVRDLFCFATFTGQRWSDIERFDKSQVQGDVWIFEAYKTKSLVKIDLIGFASSALDILKKYDYKLPKISLVKFNLYIKKAAAAAGINSQVKIRRYSGANEIEIEGPKHEFVSSHMARRTCVSILLNVYNVPITAVQEITGHSDLKTLQKYINKDRKARQEAMERTARIDEPLTVVKKAI